MGKLSKSTRTVIIAAGVLLVLGVVCLVLFITQPTDGTESTGSQTSSMTSEVEESISITEKTADDVISAKITNEKGSYTFERSKRVVSTTDSDGNVTSKDEYFWISKQMATLSPNDTTVRAFMNSLAGLSVYEVVEEGAEDLEKYGLKDPLASAQLSFEDGSSQTICFGIRNPASTGHIYCRTADSNDVYLVSYYSTANVFEPIMSFVNLTFTESYDPNNAKELDYLIIERKDMDEAIEISYMYDVQAQAEDEDAIITTFNAHRVTTPVLAEVDSTKGQKFCYGLYGLTASECISIATNEELLSLTGLDDPFCKVTFKYGGNRYGLILGDPIEVVTETDDEGTPSLTTVTGYYGMIEGNEGVYAFAKDSTPWYTFTLQDIVSRRPVSPYIYSVDSVVITTPEKEYVFKVNGDAEDNSFFYGEQELDGDKFRQFYQHLITAVGDELYLTDGEYEDYISVRFNYRSEYTDVYGTEYDELKFYKSDDRKNIVRVNGKVLFKVRQVYTERLLSNLDALLSGGDIVLNW